MRAMPIFPQLSREVLSRSVTARCTMGWARFLDVASEPTERPSRAKSHAQALFFTAFTFAHLAFCAAATFFPAAPASVPLLFRGTIFRVFRAFAHRALPADAIGGRAVGERLRELLPFTYVLPKAEMAAVSPDSSLCNRPSSFFSKSKTSFKTDIQFPSLWILSTPRYSRP